MEKLHKSAGNMMLVAVVVIAAVLLLSIGFIWMRSTNKQNVMKTENPPLTAPYVSATGYPTSSTTPITGTTSTSVGSSGCGLSSARLCRRRPRSRHVRGICRLTQI